MSDKQITITRALAELGTIAGRITNAINEGTFVSVVKGSKNKPCNAQFKDVADLNLAMQSSFDKVSALLLRQKKLRACVVTSNSTTYVTIGSESMTVAQAIDQKNLAHLRKMMLSTLRLQLAQSKVLHDKLALELETKIETALHSLYSAGKDKVDDLQYANIANPLKDDHTPKIVAGIADISAYIVKEADALAVFLTECDYVLSESNCQTYVTV